MSHIVVIGAGQAGSSLVAKLRKGGFDGDITLIGPTNVTSGGMASVPEPATTTILGIGGVLTLLKHSRR